MVYHINSHACRLKPSSVGFKLPAQKGSLGTRYKAQRSTITGFSEHIRGGKKEPNIGTRSDVERAAADHFRDVLAVRGI